MDFSALGGVVSGVDFTVEEFTEREEEMRCIYDI